MILINGQTDDRIAIQDRGLQYGDGLFETIAYRNNNFEFLDDHLDRLTHGCERLNISTAFIDELKADLSTIKSQQTSSAVVKVIISRGQGGRGYKPPTDAQPTRIVSVHPFPDYPESYQNGVNVISCKQTLSRNKTLAGLKHLNRLEQVLARSEWTSDDIAEGLMQDEHGHVIEGTMTNIFWVKSNQLMTPELSYSGVNGVMKQQILKLAKQHQIEVVETSVTQQDLLMADEVFLTNSIIGIWPVSSIDGEAIAPVDGVTKLLQSSLKDSVK